MTNQPLCAELFHLLEVVAISNPDRSASVVLKKVAESLYDHRETLFEDLVITYSDTCTNPPHIFLRGRLRPFRALVFELRLNRFSGGFWDLLLPQHSGVDPERYHALAELLGIKLSIPV